MAANFRYGAAAAFAAALLLPVAAVGQTRVFVDFENQSDGEPYLADNWLADGFSEAMPWQQGFDDGRVFVADAPSRLGSSRSIRVAYPKGGVGPAETGAQVALALEPRPEYFLSYWLRFDEGFSWGSENHGGKLPGLAGGELCSGGARCDGANGFTARLMWRQDGKAVLYLYHMDKPGKYGEDYALRYPSGEQVVFTPGQWFQVVEQVRINAGEARDGSVKLWINGQPVLALDGLRFVSNGDGVDRFLFSTFHGGGDPTWAPERDSYVNFDDFRVGSSYEKVGGLENPRD